MRTETIIRYIANDGIVFENSQDCIFHESKTKPIVITSLSSDKLSNLIWGDSECSAYENEEWAEYLKIKLDTLQKIYDVFSKENNDDMLKFRKNFDYYELGDVIEFFQLLRIDVERNSLTK